MDGERERESGKSMLAAWHDDDDDDDDYKWLSLLETILSSMYANCNDSLLPSVPIGHHYWQVL